MPYMLELHIRDDNGPIVLPGGLRERVEVRLFDGIYHQPVPSENHRDAWTKAGVSYRVIDTHVYSAAILQTTIEKKP